MQFSWLGHLVQGFLGKQIQIRVFLPSDSPDGLPPQLVSVLSAPFARSKIIFFKWENGLLYFFTIANRRFG